MTMQTYLGMKKIRAKPMNRRDYNHLRGWEVPIDENPDDEGYLVEYLDGGKANVEGFDGYVSWSPSDVFDLAYKPVGLGLTFGDVLEALKRGHRAARAGWNGKGMWLMLVPAEMADSIAFQYAALNPLPWIGMKTADDSFVPWLASQTDMLASDWMIV